MEERRLVAISEPGTGRLGTSLAYGVVDADNHYYEPYDAFTRHLDPKFGDYAVNIRHDGDGLGRVYIGDQRLAFMSVTQTDHVAAPGSLQKFFKGEASRSELELPVIHPRDHPALMQRDARLQLMDEQGLDATILLPSLGVCVEHELHHDVEATYANLVAFNRWLEEDWGYSYQGRVFAVPLLSLLDVDRAVAELDRVLGQGARLVHLKPGPVYGRSPADPCFDPFWARVSEAGVPVLFHLSDSGYNEFFSAQWGENPRPSFHKQSAFQLTTCWMSRPISDTMAALVLHNLFGRFPELRVLSVENGSRWVAPLLKVMDKAADSAKTGHWLGGPLSDKPSEVFRQHVYVCPFYEENVPALVDLMGSKRVLFGSDYPHPEGLATPLDFVAPLGSLDDDTLKAIMRDNTAELLRLA